MDGVKAKLPIDLENTADVGADEESLEQERFERIQALTTSLIETRKIVRDNLETAQSKQKDQYDLKHRAPTYKVGDKVLKYNRRRETRMGDKLQQRFTGPFQIIQILGRGVYRLKDGDKEMKQTANASNLKPWVDQVSQSKSPKANKPHSKHETDKVISSQEILVEDEHSLANDVETTPKTVIHSNVSLSKEEKELKVSGEWLDDRTIDSANRMVSKVMCEEESQTSLLAQGSHGFKPVQHENCQVLYGDNHWVAVGCMQNEIYLANSLGTEIASVVVKQIKQLYSHLLDNEGQLLINFVRCSQQPNTSDCGVFAIAFIFEWAIEDSMTTNMDINFVVADMRSHLLSCLETGEVAKFPRKRRSHRKVQAQVIKTLRL